MNIHKKYNHRSSEKGVVSVYMALMVVIVMVGSTLILADIVSRQFRSSADVELTERAFYGASTGFEQAAYRIKTDEIEPGTNDGDNVGKRGGIFIQYNDVSVVIDYSAYFTLDGNSRDVHAICSEGEIIDRGYVSRSLTFGEDCQPWIDRELRGELNS